MSDTNYQTTFSSKITIIKKCHMCGHINEGKREMESCSKCHKGFLPLGYFSKVHAKTSQEYKELFAYSEELHPDDIVKGLYVLW